MAFSLPRAIIKLKKCQDPGKGVMCMEHWERQCPCQAKNEVSVSNPTSPFAKNSVHTKPNIPMLSDAHLDSPTTGTVRCTYFLSLEPDLLVGLFRSVVYITI